MSLLHNLISYDGKGLHISRKRDQHEIKHMKGHGHLNKSKSQMGRVREAFPANLVEHASKRSESVPYSNKEVSAMSIKDSANMLFVQPPKLLKPQGQFEKTNTALQLERSTNFDGVLNPSLQQEQQLLYGLNSKRLAIMQELKNDRLIEGNYKERLEQELKLLNDKLNPKSEIDKLIEAMKQNNIKPVEPVKPQEEIKQEENKVNDENKDGINIKQELTDEQENAVLFVLTPVKSGLFSDDIKDYDKDVFNSNDSIKKIIMEFTEGEDNAKNLGLIDNDDKLVLGTDNNHFKWFLLTYNSARKELGRDLKVEEIKMIIDGIQRKGEMNIIKSNKIVNEDLQMANYFKRAYEGDEVKAVNINKDTSKPVIIDSIINTFGKDKAIEYGLITENESYAGTINNTKIKYFFEILNELAKNKGSVLDDDVIKKVVSEIKDKQMGLKSKNKIVKDNSP
jgi:hypothetical protein